MVENNLYFTNKELTTIGSRVLGISGENEQEKLIFSFDTFVNGTAYLEVEFPNPKLNKVFIELTKVNQTYQIEVKNSLLVCEGTLKMQLRIAGETSVWKSKQFEMLVLEAVNAIDRIDDDYPNFILITNNRLSALEEETETNTKDIEELQNGLAGAEVTSNKVTSLSSSSTNTQYPGAKLVYDELAEKQTQIDALVEENTKYKAQIPTGHKKTDSVQLTDSAEGLAIENVALWGATEQAQYTGKNILDILKYKDVGYSYTNCGITFTVLEGGKIKATGTATSNADFYLVGSWSSTSVVETLESGNYTLEVNGGNYIGQKFYIINSSSIITNTGLNGIVNFNIENSQSITAFMFRIDSGYTVNEIFEIMLLNGTYNQNTIPDYEPYCGEKASPNPDYPQAVHCVTGDCNVKMHNRNFFDKNTTFTTSRTLDVSTGELTSSSNDWAVSDYVEIFKTKNAVLSGKLVPVGWNVRICAYDKNKNFVYGTAIAYSSSDTVFQITAENEFCYIRFAKNSANYDADTVQLEIGTTKTSYKPYAEDNLYNSADITLNRYLDSSGQLQSVSSFVLSDYMPIEAQKRYVYSGLTNVGIAPYTCYYDANKQFISSFKQATGENIITTPVNSAYIRFSIHYNDKNNFNFVKIIEAPLTLGNLELYEGDKIQISYTEKAGYKKVTGANVVKNMAKYTFTGNEKITVAQSGTSSFYYSFLTGINAIESVLPKCNFFIGAKITTTSTNEGVWIISNGQIRIRYGEEQTVETFKSWLTTEYANGTPLEVVYGLATPETTPITDTTLLAQLETLINMKTYKEITNIDAEGADLPPVIEFDYYKDMTTVDDRLTALEARIELLEE